MNRRRFLASAAVASTGLLAGCPSSPAAESPSTSRARPLANTTLFVSGRFDRVANGTLYVAASRPDGETVQIDVSDNAGPLVCTESADGTLDCERQQRWDRIDPGAKVCATVNVGRAGSLDAVKIFVNAVCTMQPPAD